MNRQVFARQAWTRACEALAIALARFEDGHRQELVR